MKKNKPQNIGSMVNTIIALLGIVLIVIGLLINSDYENSYLETIFMSVGTSILATAIVSYLTSFYLVKVNTIKEIIEKWGLVNIYKSKSEMNVVSNQFLTQCQKNIDIMAIGMSGFLNAQEDTLRRLISKGVEIRIISCNSKEYLSQREMDESISGNSSPRGNFYEEVKDLKKWIDEVKKETKNAKISIKFHATYPAFSYLRIDNHAFWGPDLYLKKSQLCLAFEFLESGDGFSEFQAHFDKLWNSSMLTEVLYE